MLGKKDKKIEIDMKTNSQREIMTQIPRKEFPREVPLKVHVIAPGWKELEANIKRLDQERTDHQNNRDWRSSQSG